MDCWDFYQEVKGKKASPAGELRRNRATHGLSHKVAEEPGCWVCAHPNPTHVLLLSKVRSLRGRVAQGKEEESAAEGQAEQDRQTRHGGLAIPEKCLSAQRHAREPALTPQCWVAWPGTVLLGSSSWELMAPQERVVH